MPATRISSWRVRTFEAPLRRAFVTALGRKTSTVNVSFELRLRGGARGYGEASASLALAELSPAALSSCLRRLGESARGRDAEEAGELVRRAWREEGGFSPACAAFEAALLEALAASRGLTLADALGGGTGSLETDLTLSAVSPAEVAEAAREAAGRGFRRLKVKLRGDPEDLARAEAASRAARRPALVLDGNQGLTEGGALRLVEAALRRGLRVELLEQPLPKGDLKGMARLTRRCPVPVAADESASSPGAALRVAEARAASVLNLKLAKTGLSGALQCAAVARAAGLGLMIGCMAETAAGLRASVHLALALRSFRWTDLDSDLLLDLPPGDCGWVRRGPMISLK